MANVDYKELKKGGFMKQVDKDRFSLRLRIVGAQIKSEQLAKINEIAQKYGAGYVHMTARQGIEIPFIKLQDIEVVKEELAKAGLQPGACGPRVRTITACQGSAICPSGLINTTELAKEFDERYYARELPHKFKIGITGCRNNCLKAEENDIGVKGGMMPTWMEHKCIYCGLCEAVCPVKVIQVKKQERQLFFNEKNCIYCGKCVKVCTTSAWEGKSGFVVYFGGLFGNKISIGKQLFPIIFSKEVLHKIIEETLMFFEERGKAGESFGTTLDRVGWDLLKNRLMELLESEEEFS